MLKGGILTKADTYKKFPPDRDRQAVLQASMACAVDAEVFYVSQEDEMCQQEKEAYDDTQDVFAMQARSERTTNEGLDELFAASMGGDELADAMLGEMHDNSVDGLFPPTADAPPNLKRPLPPQDGDEQHKRARVRASLMAAVKQAANDYSQQ